MRPPGSILFSMSISTQVSPTGETEQVFRPRHANLNDFGFLANILTVVFVAFFVFLIGHQGDPNHAIWFDLIALFLVLGYLGYCSLGLYHLLWTRPLYVFVSSTTFGYMDHRRKRHEWSRSVLAAVERHDEVHRGMTGRPLHQWGYGRLYFMAAQPEPSVLWVLSQAGWDWQTFIALQKALARQA